MNESTSGFGLLDKASNEADNSLAFCPSEFGRPTAAEALFHIIPAPLEKTVSYGAGTTHGPEAILRASDELEPVYLGDVPGFHGAFVKETIPNSLPTNEFFEALASSVSEAVSAQKVPIILGGEHALTFGAFSGMMRHYSNNEIGIIQIDAHADLRDEYHGDPSSHACVMRRIHEKWQTSILQIGVRGISLEEHTYRHKNSDTIYCVDAPEVWKNGLSESLIPDNFPQKVYLTFDVDGLDASLMPATGTPSPGGLFWHQIEQIFSIIRSSGRQLVGFDVVELAPIPDFSSPDFTTAVAVYAGMHLAAEAWSQE
jgi:agmatinase